MLVKAHSSTIFGRRSEGGRGAMGQRVVEEHMYVQRRAEVPRRRLAFKRAGASRREKGLVSCHRTQPGYGDVAERGYAQKHGFVPACEPLHKNGLKQLGTAGDRHPYTEPHIEPTGDLGHHIYLEQNGGPPRRLPLQNNYLDETAFRDGFYRNGHSFNVHLAHGEHSLGSAYEPNMNSLIFATIIVDFLDGGERNIQLIRMLKGFCMFLPRTLLNGFVYLRRYTSNFEHRFKHVDQLVKTYLACCILAKKYGTDMQVFNMELLKGWDIDLGELNYCEALVMNTLNYDLYVPIKEYEFICCYIRNNNYRCYWSANNNCLKGDVSDNKL